MNGNKKKSEHNVGGSKFVMVLLIKCFLYLYSNVQPGSIVLKPKQMFVGLESNEKQTSLMSKDLKNSFLPQSLLVQAGFY